MNTGPSAALAHVQHVWRNAPDKSWQRFKSALHMALKNSLTSGMVFHPDDLRRMAKENRLGRWLTDGGEWLYALACGSERGSENTSAAIAFEKHLGRPAYLWAEETKTPGRLHVGSRFTWQGHYVTVTSFAADGQSLTACAYKSQQHRSTREVGDNTYFDQKARRIEALVRYNDGTVCLRLGSKAETDESAVIERRFKVTHAAASSARKAYDATRRRHEQAIASATTLEELEAASKAASAEGVRAFRHFDLDLLRDAIKAKRVRIHERMTDEERRRFEEARETRHADDLRRWMAGEQVTNLFTRKNCLRVKDGHVEASNGNRVTLAAARTALAFVRRHRKKGWQANGQTHDVEAFPLRSVDKEGITIGCTQLAWGEIDRVAKQL